MDKGRVIIRLDLDAVNGYKLTSEEINILPAKEKVEIITTTRIGISKSIDLPPRFYIKDNPYISR